MEIETKYDLIENDNDINAFKFDNEGQNLSNNVNFMKWKKEMIKKYGKNAKLFRCNEDNLLFYLSNEDTKGDHLHLGRCPKCHKYICFFCSRKGYQDDNAECCLSRKIRYILFNQELDPDIGLVNILEVLPITSFMFIIGIFFRGFYYRLTISDRLRKKTKKRIFSEFANYEAYLTKLVPIVIIHGLSAFFLSISFVILNTEFMIIFLIFNLIFNFRPLRYLSSMIRFDM